MIKEGTNNVIDVSGKAIGHVKKHINKKLDQRKNKDPKYGRKVTE